MKTTLLIFFAILSMMLDVYGFQNDDQAELLKYLSQLNSKLQAEDEAFEESLAEENNLERLLDIAMNPDGRDYDPVIERIAQIDTPAAADALVSLVLKSDRFVSGKALCSLMDMQPNLKISRLVELLHKPTLRIHDKGRIISHLRAFPGEEVEAAILSYIDDDDLQPQVLSTLGYIGTARSVDILRQYAENGIEGSKSIAVHSLKRVETRIESSGEDDYQVPELPDEPPKDRFSK